MTSTNEIRTAFLEFFRKNDHEVINSSPLVPRNDPTLMFTNAGMVQFKNAFTGVEKLNYSRATTSQKCVRAGGKHNDLENVGHTARHHTFFEMLGNFSFGDYFKEHAIECAWSLITKEFGIGKERLLVTVYHEDEEAFALWQKISGLPEYKIIPIGTSDNFWAMGNTGPCGPCSEIFYDHGEQISGGPPGSADEDGDRFVEIWNLVFMQYDQVSDNKREDLPKPSIDTGMGLERIAAVLQGTHDNYEIDLLRYLIEASAEASGKGMSGENAISHRVIADHLRACSFLIADGVLPSNEGRGYVLRRIMRRAMRHAHLLGCKEPLMTKLVNSLVTSMGQHYPELFRAEALIAETLKLEEERFKDMLDRGLKMLDQASEKIPVGGQLSGEIAFKLYDTYGFPVDLTEDILKGQKQGLDVKGFNAAMANQRAKARNAWMGSGDVMTEAFWFDLREEIGPTEFLGYDTEVAEGIVNAILINGDACGKAIEGEDITLIFNQTPFYAESGGQQGDHGSAVSVDGATLEISDTKKKLDDIYLHAAKVLEGELSLGDVLNLRVNKKRREKLKANHSVTHLMHAALRKELGIHVTQKGSLVAPEYLRFDFSHRKSLKAEELRAVEVLVNEQIRGNRSVKTLLMTPDDAVEAGAMALFGEKYGNEVRVVSMGNPDLDGQVFSRELCGGTHVKRLGEIGFFKILGENAVAAGVRRIEACTGEAAYNYIINQEYLLAEASTALKVKPGKIPGRVSGLLEERRKLEKQVSQLRQRLAVGEGKTGESEHNSKNIAGIQFIAKTIEGVPAKELKSLVDTLKQQVGSGVIAIIAVNSSKASLVVGVTKDLLERVDAISLVHAGAAAIGGKAGGGRPDMAQTGGPNGAGAAQALLDIERAISKAEKNDEEN